MLFVTHYELIGEPSKARTQELMALFGERGAGEFEILIDCVFTPCPWGWRLRTPTSTTPTT